MAIVALRIGIFAAWSIALASWSMPACATDLPVEIRGGDLPLADAVVSLHPTSPPPMPSPTSGRASMDQRDSTFVPGVLAVQVGTVVAFPNSDQVQHQVYSFSQAKRFELPLYAGRDARPVLFDVAGVVVLGCNIHDWMIGHIVVLDTPHFGKTGTDGTVRLQAPPGDYTLRVWHARAEGGAVERRISLAGAQAGAQRIALAVGAPEEARGNDRLRALQQKFRRMKDPP